LLELRCGAAHTDKDAPSRLDTLAEIASQAERDEDPVLAVVGREDGLLELAPVLHELRASLEGGAVLATHVDGDAPVLRDPTRLETRALGGEVDGVVVEPAPSWHGAGLARIAIRGQVEIARAAQRSGELGIP